MLFRSLFSWLFKSWLACMSECPPNAIITDHNKAIKKVIEIVFPIEDFNSFNSRIFCITIYDMEKQFQSTYTLRKFTDFQNEIVGCICCSLSSCREHNNFSKYEVREDVSHGEG